MSTSRSKAYYVLVIFSHSTSINSYANDFGMNSSSEASPKLPSADSNSSSNENDNVTPRLDFLHMREALTISPVTPLQIFTSGQQEPLDEILDVDAARSELESQCGDLPSPVFEKILATLCERHPLHEEIGMIHNTQGSMGNDFEDVPSNFTRHGTMEDNGSP